MFVIACSDVDNYEAPHQTLSGSLIDTETGEAIPSQAPNGLRIRLYDQQYTDPQPIDFWGTQEGTFTNNRLFAGDYKLIADNGGFYPLDTVLISLPVEGDLTIEATPYLRISAEATASNGNIIVSYTIAESKPNESQIVEKGVFVNSTHYVDMNNFVNDNPFTDLSSVDDAETTQGTITDTITGLEAGNTYYLRVGASSDNIGSHYNYSKVIKVELP